EAVCFSPLAPVLGGEQSCSARVLDLGSRPFFTAKRLHSPAQGRAAHPGGPYREAVTLRSPGSRSPPWGTSDARGFLPRRGCTPMRPVLLCNPCGVENPGLAPVPRVRCAALGWGM